MARTQDARSPGWLEEIETSLEKLFPKNYFSALRDTIEGVTGDIDDLEDEMRTTNRRGRHILDATSTVEVILARMKRRQKSLSSGLSRTARADMGGRPTKDEVEGFILQSNRQYATLVERIENLEVLLGFLKGDSYGKGGLKEQMRFRKDLTQELSVRERRGMDDEAVVD